MQCAILYRATTAIRSCWIIALSRGKLQTYARSMCQNTNLRENLNKNPPKRYYPMRKEVGWRYHSIGLPSNYSRCDFHTNLYKPHPVRGLKLTSEPCFCHLQSIIVTQHRVKKIVGDFWINFGGFFTIVKPPLRTASNIASVFWFVWRIFLCASPIIAVTLK